MLIDLLEKKSPHLATRLRYHSPKWVKLPPDIIPSNMNKIDVLYVYGLGTGALYQHLKEWLKIDHHFIVYVVDDLDSIYMFLQEPIAQEILLDASVLIKYCANDDFVYDLAPCFWRFASLNCEVLAQKQNHDTERYRTIRSTIQEYSVLCDYITQGDWQYGHLFFQNLYGNLPILSSAYQGQELKQKFKNVPAIFCGAGPSLSKHLPLLNQFRDKALIMGGGSSLTALSAAGITPHLAFGLDPSLDECERFLAHSAFETPLCFRFRLNPEALKCAHSRKVYAAGCGWYGLEQMLEEQCSIFGGDIDEGYSVSCLALSTAISLGCNPIITLGMDMAFTGLKEYAEGVNQAWEPKSQTMQDHSCHWNGAQTFNDIYGKPTITKWRWLIERDYISKYSSSNLINATEGGIGFKGIPNIPFAQVAEQYLKKSYDLNARVHSSIEVAQKVNAPQEKTTAYITAFSDSLERCISLYDEIIELIQEQEQRLRKRESQLSHWNQTGKGVQLQLDLEDELAYKGLLEWFHSSYERSDWRQHYHTKTDLHFLMLALKYQLEGIISIRNIAYKHASIKYPQTILEHI